MPIKNIKKYVFWYILPLVLWMAFIIYFSSIQELPTIRGIISNEPVPKGAWTGDEIEHVIEYAILAFLFFRAFIYTRYQKYAIIATVFFCVIFGIFDELHQSFVPLRTLSIRDLFWDIIGSSTVRFSSILLKRQ